LFHYKLKNIPQTTFSDCLDILRIHYLYVVVEPTQLKNVSQNAKFCQERANMTRITTYKTSIETTKKGQTWEYFPTFGVKKHT